MKVVSLFSGGGLGDYGLELSGMKIVGQVEIDEYCQKILNLRWPDVPKWRDIKNVDGKQIVEKCGSIDLISGGFPCQPFSIAGKQRGQKDDRHLWPEMLRIIKQVKPAYVLAENVPGLIRIGLDDVLHDLETEGYATGTVVFPAHAVGAPHKRERVWIVAYSNTKRSQGRNGEELSECSGERAFGKSDTFMADTQSVGCRRRRMQGCEKKSNGLVQDKQKRAAVRGKAEGCNSFTIQDFWKTEPSVGRGANGITNRVDRLKLLGNGQVVQAVQWIGERIMEHGYK